MAENNAPNAPMAPMARIFDTAQPVDSAGTFGDPFLDWTRPAYYHSNGMAWMLIPAFALPFP